MALHPIPTAFDAGLRVTGMTAVWGLVLATRPPQWTGHHSLYALGAGAQRRAALKGPLCCLDLSEQEPSAGLGTAWLCLPRPSEVRREYACCSCVLRSGHCPARLPRLFLQSGMCWLKLSWVPGPVEAVGGSLLRKAGTAGTVERTFWSCFL